MFPLNVRSMQASTIFSLRRWLKECSFIFIPYDDILLYAFHLLYEIFIVAILYFFFHATKVCNFNIFHLWKCFMKTICCCDLPKMGSYRKNVHKVICMLLSISSLIIFLMTFVDLTLRNALIERWITRYFILQYFVDFKKIKTFNRHSKKCYGYKMVYYS